jgi:hypothetical protein
LEFGQKLVEKDHLSAVVDQVLVSSKWSWLGAVEQVRMVAAFSGNGQLVHDFW